MSVFGIFAIHVAICTPLVNACKQSLIKPAVPAIMRCRAKLAFIIVVIAGLAVCSFKTLYNQLDYLIPEYVQDTVSLDDVLEQKLEQRTQVCAIPS